MSTGEGVIIDTCDCASVAMSRMLNAHVFNESVSVFMERIGAVSLRMQKGPAYCF